MQDVDVEVVSRPQYAQWLTRSHFKLHRPEGFYQILDAAGNELCHPIYVPPADGDGALPPAMGGKGKGQGEIFTGQDRGFMTFEEFHQHTCYKGKGYDAADRHMRYKGKGYDAAGRHMDYKGKGNAVAAAATAKGKGKGQVGKGKGKKGKQLIARGSVGEFMMRTRSRSRDRDAAGSSSSGENANRYPLLQ